MNEQAAAQTSPLETIGVMGAGTMGNGIAHVFARNGFKVRLCDVQQSFLDRAHETIRENLARETAKGKLTASDAQLAMQRVHGTLDRDALADCHFILEAATERFDVKSEIFRDLDRIALPDAVLASNTSSISITRLASITDRPDKFIGLHFMRPVQVMKLVEIIRGIATSPETHETAHAFAQSLGKETTNAEDYPAFIVNRVLVPMINEAIYTLYEGVGTVTSIDMAMKLGANHPMGPLELGDFIGLDTVLAIMNVLHDGLADSKYRPCPLLVKYVEAGWLGQKSGRGFYDYRGDQPVPTR